DVAGVDADGGDARVDRAQGERGVEVDVGDDGQRRAGHDRGQRVRVPAAGDGHAGELAAGVREPPDLAEGRLDVVRLGQRHRLDDDGRSAPDRDVANPDP